MVLRPSPNEHRHVHAHDQVFATFSYYGEWYDTIQAYKQRGLPRPSDSDAANARAKIAQAMNATITEALAALEWNAGTVCVAIPGSNAAGTERVSKLAEGALRDTGIATALALWMAPHNAFNTLGKSQRPSPAWIASRMTLDPLALQGAERILVIDDVLTTGAHWRACCDRINATGRACAGVFAAHHAQPEARRQ